MYIPEESRRGNDEIIVITGRSDIDFWCQRFSISPYTLFQLMRTVGNSARQIGDFIHKNEKERLDKVEESIKNISIL
jgi:hypothetical protein